MAKKYIDLAQKIALDWGYMSSEAWRALDWLDEHPDQLPSRKITLTESQVEVIGRDAINYFKPGGTWADWARAVFMSADFPIVPDPEPTNTDKLKALYDQWLESDAPACRVSFHKFMDAAGVKAPGADE